jgi:pseudomonalisin
MHSQTFHRLHVCLSTALLLLMTGMLSLNAQAQRAINDADRVTLHGNTHPLARAEFDRGSASATTAMNNIVLLLSVRPEAQAELQQLLAEQQDPKSPSYHKWLTPTGFGLRFGPTDQDIADVTSWLKKFGFTIDQVSSGRMWINFSGDVQKVERAFQTNIRQYEVNGKMHHANASDPTIPRALTGLVKGLVSLNDFRKHPQSTVNQLPPDFTSGTGENFLAPADFATIYNVNPLYSASPAIDGTGQTIAIVGRTDINLSDVQFFRSFFGLPANDPVFIHNGPDPGDLGGNEEAEADLDVEWSGAVAKNATIDFVISQSTATTDGVDLSAQFIVNNNIATVMSTSFGLCETALGAAGNDFWNTLWQQAAAQGITAFVSTGDSGAAGCDAATATAGTGTGVNGLGSTPNNIAVGGTEFNEGTGTFWSPTNDPTTQASVLSYIPEVAWNESGNVTGGSGLFATGGGASAIYPKPAFQAGPGVPADGARDVPDVALSSASHDGYLMIQGHSATASGLETAGGTSAASPSFAGLMALVVQKTGTSQGNANPVLYSMGQNQFAGGTAVYHDATTGDNSVPGVTGFTAGTGYDQATGWGSVDAANLVNLWNNNVTPDFTVSADPASQSVNQGVTANYTVTLNAAGGFANPVTLSISGLPTDASASFTPASVIGSGTSALAISTALTTPVGSYPLTITATDGVISHTASITLVVTTPDFTLSANPASQTVETGISASYTATISPLNGYAGTVSFSVNGLPAGASATFTPASVNTSGSSTLVISTTAGTTPAGNYLITITASDGTLTHSTSVNLSVTDFTLDATPIAQTIVVGGSATYSATLTGLNGYAGTANLSVTGLPPFATATFTPPSITGSGSSSLVIATTSNTPAAIYSLTVTASDGIEARSVPLTLEVDPKGNFSISISPTSASVNPGQNIGYGVTVSSSGGFTAVASLSISGLPSGVTATLSPSSVQGSGLVSLSIQTAADTPGGSYSFTITGTSGPLVRTATGTLVVLAPDFSLSATPASQPVQTGQSVNYSVTLTPVNDYAGTVNFSISGLPSGVTAIFSPASLTTSGTTTLSVAADGTAVPGTYSLVITGTDGVRTHSVSVTLTVTTQPTPDFNISAPAAISVKRNGDGIETVTITGLNGFTGTVNLTVSGLPSTVTPCFNTVTPCPATASVTGSGTANLNLHVDHRAQQGVFPFTITGTSGGLNHSVNVTLTIQ